MPNEARSEPVIGVVSNVAGATASGCFFGNIPIADTLIQGETYYLKTSGPDTDNPITSEPCNNCECPNRLFGQATCSPNTLTLTLENPLCGKCNC